MKDMLKYIVLVVIYRILLDLIYMYQIEPNFNYMLFVNLATYYSKVTSWIIVFVLLPFFVDIIRNGKNNLIAYCSIFFYFARIIPFSSFLQFQPQTFNFYFLNIVFWLIIYIGFSHLKNDDKMMGVNHPGAINIIALIATFTIILVSGVYVGFRINLSLDNVYDLREEVRNFNMPIILQYLYESTSNVIPILSVYYITINKKYWVYLLTFMGLLSFSVAGSKATLFKTLLILFLSIIHNKDFKRILIPSFVLICIFSLIEYVFFQGNFISAILIRRMFYMPSLLDSLYYNYISSHEPLYYNTSLNTALNFAIGDYYFGHDEMRANNGFFSDAYANLGAFGVLFYPIILVFFIKYCNRLCNGLNTSIPMFFALILVITVGGSFFTTTLLTHGLFFVCITLFMMPKQTSTGK